MADNSNFIKNQWCQYMPSSLHDNNYCYTPQVSCGSLRLITSLCQGGPCSLLLLQFPLLLPAPFNFLSFAPFLLFPCSFFIFLCSLLAFNFSSCSMLLFQIFHCSMLLVTIFGAPCSRITLVCSLLLYLFYGLLLAPLFQIGLAPCSGITPNGVSLKREKLKELQTWQNVFIKFVCLFATFAKPKYLAIFK